MSDRVDFSPDVSVRRPDQPRIHPAWRDLDAGAVSWMHRFGIPPDPTARDDLTHYGVGRNAARLAPHGNRAGLQLLADFFALLYAFDDAVDEGPMAARPYDMIIRFARLVRTLEAPQVLPDGQEDDPFLAAWRDIRMRLDDIAPRTIAIRWVETVRAALFAWIQDALNRSHVVTPRLDDYIVSRMASGLVPPVAVVLAVVADDKVPLEQLGQPAVRALTEMASSLDAWKNDVISYHKEHIIRHDEPNNLIDVLANEFGIDHTTAQAEAIGICEQAKSRFLTLSEQVMRKAAPPLRTYLTCLTAIACAEPESAIADRFLLTSGNLACVIRPADDTASKAARCDLQDMPSIVWWWGEDI